MNTHAVRTCFCAEPNAVGETQIRCGGVGGRSVRANGIASSIANVRPLKWVGNPSEIRQKRISVEHETVQQLPGCGLSPPRRSCCDVCSGVILHPDTLGQQSRVCVTAITFGLAASGQRKVIRQTINKALNPALRMTLQFNASPPQIKE